MSDALPPLPHARHRDLPDLTRAALVVIDLQRAFTDSSQPPFVRDAPQAVANSARLVEAFRRTARPIVFTRHAHLVQPKGHGMATWWSSFLLEGSDAAQLDPALVPVDGELVLRKHHYSAFRQTSLHDWLSSRGVDTLALAGTMTHICVDTTARDAFMHGYDVVVVADACASKHPALHDSALQGLSHAVARIARVSDLMDRLGGGR